MSKENKDFDWDSLIKDKVDIAFPSNDVIVATLLKTFSKLYFKLHEQNTSNVFIVGTAAMHLMGLDVGRDIADLDIAVYRPNANQLMIIDALSTVSSLESNYPVSCGNNVYEFNKKKLKCNILTFQEIKEKPGLKYREFNLGRINTAWDAKKSYGRPKDLRDSLKMKELNFNVLI